MATAALDQRSVPNLATSDIEQGLRNLETYGYTVHENFLSPEQLRALSDRFDEQAEMERRTGLAQISQEGHAAADFHIGSAQEDVLPAFQMISSLPNKGQVFRDLMLHPIATAYADRMFQGQGFILHAQSGLILRKGGARQLIHADQQMVPFPTPFPLLLNVMVCLSDYEPEMGSTRIVPGSHKFGRPDLSKNEDGKLADIGGEIVASNAKAGSAVIFEGRTWHCQWFSESTKVRRSIANVYCVEYYHPVDNFPAIIHDDVYLGLSDDEKRLLGFGSPANGRVEPRTPGDPRSNTGRPRPFTPELHRGDNDMRA